jgi:hypothetical protein
MKKILLLLIPSYSFALLLVPSAHAQLSIFPSENVDSTNVESIVTRVASGGNVIDNYAQEAKKLDGDVSTQIASGVMSRNTILNYAAYIVRFLSQLGLMIGGIMIIYAGYQYTTTVFGGNASSGNTAIKNAVAGILVIVFSYAIMRIITTAFLT